MDSKVLVTGGTGFLGMRIISELLKQGYDVRTTVRSINKQANILNTMKANDIPTERLTFVEADLSSDEHWDDAMQGCQYVLSVASPVFFEIPDDESEVIRPAIEGVQRILRAADHAGVQRVVMTSNFGAVGFSNKDKSSITTERNWTDEHEPGLSAYEKSKLLAEKAAWNYVENATRKIEFATINPVAMMGPSLDAHISGSFDLVKNLVNGSMKRIPNIALNIVDVMPEIAALIKKERPNLAQKVSTKRVPNFILSLGAKVNKQAKEGKLLLDINRNVSNEQARKYLGWTPIATQEEAILAALDSIVQYDLLNN